MDKMLFRRLHPDMDIAIVLTLETADPLALLASIWEMI